MRCVGHRGWWAVSYLLLCGFLFSVEGLAQKRNCATDPQSGVEVCQITTEGSNRISYYDIPLYSAVFNKIVYLKKTELGPPKIIIANPDGSGEEAVALGQDPIMSPDGKKVYYITRSGQREPGMDLYAYDLGTRHESRITRVRANRLIQFSPAALTHKGNLLVYSPGNVASLIYDDGSGDTPLQFDDPYKSDTFHRLRISPTTPNLIFYNRNHPGQLHPLYVYDVETKKTYLVSEQSTHPLWAPDGIHIAYNGGPDYHFHITRYDGTGDRELDAYEREGTAYCSFAPEGDVLACSNFDTTGRYPMPGSIFILAADASNRVAYVCEHHARQEGFWGEPALHYLQDRFHIVFRSDASGEPQVYSAELPKDFYMRLKPPRRDKSPSPAKERPR